MSNLHCPTCGAVLVDKLAGDEESDMYGCRACRQLFAIQLFETSYHFLVEDGPRPIFDQEEELISRNGKHSDKGVSL